MALRFGTDGVRGVANAELTPELALLLGRGAARVLDADRVVIGRDPRRSGPMLEAALAAGFASAGSTVELVGVLPTPAVAFLSDAQDCVGAVISASHNSFADNGIKLFAPGGRKLADDVEEAIEAELERELAGDVGARPSGAGVGVIRAIPDGGRTYRDHLVAILGASGALTGMDVALDCANGATSSAAPEVFDRLGARVVVRGASPDGFNINDGCGATHPEALAQAVAAGRFDLGLAFDGDGDRLIAVDHTGAIVDGDHILAICARDLHRRGLLRHATVVVTVMTNLGFRLAMEEAGIHVVETAVGDRYVQEALEAGGYSLGGEQSGHVVFTDLATTGDGILTGLVLADVVLRSGGTLAELAADAMTRLPQVLLNVRVQGSAGDLMQALAGDVAAAEARLGPSGRVLVRPSGTEPIVRVMVEAATHDEADQVAQGLAATLAEQARR
ncbi:MAG TPA: phosphoglucosamine mutase [Acidimicrobiales bacterium]